MKVLIANKYFFPKGGSESVMLMEREHLLAAGVDVVDFAMHDPRNLPSPFAEHFVSHSDYDGPMSAPERAAVALRLIHSGEAVRRIEGLIEKTRPDLLHCHNVYHQLTPSIIGAAKHHGLPVILTLHDYKVVCPVHRRLRHGRPCSRCLDLRFSNVLLHRCADGSLAKSALLYAEAIFQRLRRSYEQVDAVIAPSEFMRAAVTRARFPRSRVHVIPNAVDTAQIRASDADSGYLLYLGRLSFEKGIETVLRAHSGAAAEIELHVAGTGPLEADMRRRYPQARYLGHLSGEALATELRNAGAVVLPSGCYENCPMAVLEAMAYGKPVVASDIGGIPELVVNGETGLLVPAGDCDALRAALLALARDSELRRRLGMAGRERAERLYSVEAHNTALDRLYREVLDNSVRRRRRDPIAYSSMVQE